MKKLFFIACLFLISASTVSSQQLRDTSVTLSERQRDSLLKTFTITTVKVLPRHPDNASLGFLLLENENGFIELHNVFRENRMTGDTIQVKYSYKSTIDTVTEEWTYVPRNAGKPLREDTDAWESVTNPESVNSREEYYRAIVIKTRTLTQKEIAYIKRSRKKG